MVFPDPLPPSHYEAELNASFDHLTDRGLASLRRLLMMLHHEFPHIPSCPLLPIIASYFLLFMEDRDCHACMSAILESIDDNHFDCSQRNYAATLRTFQDLTKVLLVSYNIYSNEAHLTHHLKNTIHIVTFDYFFHVYVKLVLSKYFQIFNPRMCACGS